MIRQAWIYVWVAITLVASGYSVASVQPITDLRWCGLRRLECVPTVEIAIDMDGEPDGLANMAGGSGQLYGAYIEWFRDSFATFREWGGGDFPSCYTDPNCILYGLTPYNGRIAMFWSDEDVPANNLGGRAEPAAPSGKCLLGCPIYFYNQAPWEYFHTGGTNDPVKVNFRWVLLHEFGHAIGMDHTYDALSVMRNAESESDDDRTELSDIDIEARDQRYSEDVVGWVDSDCITEPWDETCRCINMNTDVSMNVFDVGLDGHCVWRVAHDYEIQRYYVEQYIQALGAWAGVGERTDSSRDGREYAIDVDLHGEGPVRLLGVLDSGDYRELSISVATGDNKRASLGVESQRAGGGRDEIDVEYNWVPRRASKDAPLGDILVVYPDDPAPEWTNCLARIVSLYQSESYGLSVDTYSYTVGASSSEQGAVRDGIISYLQGHTEYEYVLLVGDASDWEYFCDDGPYTSSVWVGEWAQVRQSYIGSLYMPAQSSYDRQRNMIPACYYYDTMDGEMSSFAPYYYSDAGYAYNMSSGVHDVVVGRLPVDTHWELSNYLDKMEAYNSPDYVLPTVDDKVVVLSLMGDVDLDPGTEDGFELCVAEEYVFHQGYPGRRLVSVYETDYLESGGLVGVGDEMYNHIKPDILHMSSTGANSYNGARYFNVSNWYMPWEVYGLTGDARPMLLASTCGINDYARVEIRYLGGEFPPFINRMMLDSSAGCISSIGPTSGSWMHANKVICKFIVDRVAEDYGRPVAKSMYMALDDVRMNYADSPEILDVAQSYVYLGDPAMRLRMRSENVTALPDAAHGRAVLVRNPIHGKVVIEVLDKSYGDIGKVVIYDLRGRVVEIYDEAEEKSGGDELVIDLGQRHPSGVYVLVITGKGSRTVHKVTMVR